MYSNIMRDQKKLMGLTVMFSLKLQNELTERTKEKNWEAKNPEKIKTSNSVKFLLALTRKNCNT